jgi:glucitol/sorbitol PTS system EIIC component
MHDFYVEREIEIVFDTLARWAQEFIAVFQAGGAVFVSLVTGIIPTLIVLLTAVNALIAWIGPERVNRVGEWAGRDGFVYTPIRYLVWPFLSVFFLTNPMAYTNGQFLPEKYKPAFYDSAVSMVHPPLGIFPHINPGELFVWLGIATGIEALGLPLGQLAVRYLITGLIVIYIRGLVTERITSIMWSRQAAAATVAMEERA